MFNRQVVNVYTGRKPGCGCITLLGWLVVIAFVLGACALIFG